MFASHWLTAGFAHLSGASRGRPPRIDNRIEFIVDGESVLRSALHAMYPTWSSSPPPSFSSCFYSVVYVAEYRKTNDRLAQKA